MIPKPTMAINDAHRQYKAKPFVANAIASMRPLSIAAINGAIRSHLNDHPETGMDGRHIGSMSKRIQGALKDELCQLLLDRLMVNWLSIHRDEGIDILRRRGALRHLLSEALFDELTLSEETPLWVDTAHNEASSLTP